MAAKVGWLRRKLWPLRYKLPDNSLGQRLVQLITTHHPWWDWGHRLMILTGSDHGGNWAEPELRTWWYRQDGYKRSMWRTGYPRRKFSIVTDYEEYRRQTEGLNEDEMYAWSALGFDQDGELFLGKRFWGGNFYGLPQDELSLLRRYLRTARRHDWYGLRSWLYSQGLHAAVYQRKPFTCGVRPPKGQGGYNHWYCKLPRRHEGMHRFDNYIFGEVGGEPIGTVFVPKDEAKR